MPYSDRAVAFYVDVAAFGLHNGNLSIILIEPTSADYGKRWTLPFGIPLVSEDQSTCARRLLRMVTGAEAVGPIHVAGVSGRGPELGAASMLEMFTVRSSEGAVALPPGADKARWFPVFNSPPFAEGHSKLLEHALDTLQLKMSGLVEERRFPFDPRKREKERNEALALAAGLIDKEFTLSELQGVIARILPGFIMDPSNFRKMMLAIGGLAETGETTRGRRHNHRPAKLYSVQTSSTEGVV